MKKTFKVVMLSTEKASPLFDKKGQLEYNINPPLHGIRDLGWKYQHLYIISDDEIKEGDWYMNKFGRLSIKVIGDKSNEGDKKIVATTDKSLEITVYSKYISTVEGKNTRYKQLPQLPESFTQAYIKAYNEGKPITEVDLEMEYNKLYPMVENNNLIIKTRPDNVFGAWRSSP